MQSNLLLAILAFLAIVGCKREAGDTGGGQVPAGPGGWLKGDSQEKFHTLADQLRGFDVAMVETGYRYIELYWAGKEGNWDYARYQADKIKLAITHGLKRRPNRAASAQPFLNTSLPRLTEAIARKDSNAFAEHFEGLTQSCNACHAMENMGFVKVSQPLLRFSPVRSVPQ